MKIIISNASPDPIYEQIVQQIKSQVLSGVLQAGEALPSIRSLARDLQISVITTKRAYEELEREGFLNAVTGKGSFIAEQNIELMREKRLKMMEDRFAELVKEARMLNMELGELQNMLTILYEED